MVIILLGKLFLNFQEIGGKFGVRISKEVRKLEAKLGNIRVSCTNSGLMNKSSCQEWLSNLIDYQDICRNSSEKPNFLLLLDSYSCHWNDNLVNCFDEEKITLNFHKIPENTTTFLQPLDRMFNHELKYFVRNFENKIITEDINIKVYDRFNLMKLWSLIWEQLSSEKFENLIKYCFINSFFDNSIEYKHVKEVCFNSQYVICEIDSCKNDFFLKCSICEISLCFKHFYIEFHNHRNINFFQ